MVKHRLWVLFLAVPFVLAISLSVGTAHAQRSSVQGAPDPSCGTSSPCIEYQNTSSGPGLESTSAAGNGIVGLTFEKSTSSSNGHAGFFGGDYSSSGSFDSGVHGVSTRGTGVLGASSSGAGVSGTSTTGVGVVGSAANRIGVLAIGGAAIGFDNVPALSATSNNLSYDIFDGCLAPKTLSGGQCDSFESVFRVDPAGFVVGNGGGSFGNGGGSFGIFGHGTEGVIGECGGTSGAEFEGEDDTGTVNYSVDCSGVLVAIVKAHNNMYATATVPRSTLPVLEDYGQARLINGVATVPLDNAYAQTISDKTPYLVFLTPNGDTNGLYIAYKTMSAFQVREIHNGRSNLVFDYRIVGRPSNDTQSRMSLMAHPPVRLTPALRQALKIR